MSTGHRIELQIEAFNGRTTIVVGIGRYYTDTGIKPVYTGIFRYRIPVFPKTQYRKIPKYRYRQKPDTEKYRNTGIKKTKYRDFRYF